MPPALLGRPPRRRPLGRGCLAAIAALALPTAALAAPADELDRIGREVAELEQQARQLEASLERDQVRGTRQVEERLTDAELFFNMRDYARASILYLDVVEHYPTHPGHPEALFRLAESLFLLQNYYGARTYFGQVLDNAGRTGFDTYVQASLGRLIEIAIHLDEFEGIDAHFTRLSQLPPAEVTAGTHYARGRLLYHQERLDEAARAFAQVPEGSDEYLRAHYHVGVIAVAQQQYEQAIQVFERVGRVEPSSGADRQVVDLAHIAAGAVYLELDQPEEAIRAYQGVGRNSRHFAQALFQAAAAFRQLGDSTRAERALEVLTVADPESHHIPRAKILRGNLLLETGRFGEAREVFQDVAEQFRPVREELERVLAREREPARYFQELVRANLEVFDASTFLPPLAVRWVREEPEFQRAMEVLEITAECGRQLDETQLLLVRLEAAVSGPSAVNLFPSLRQGAVRAVQIENRLARLRGRVAAVEEELVGRESSELREVIAERRRLEQEIRELPTDAEAYGEQEDAARAEFRGLAGQLARVAGRIDRLQAMVVAIEIYVRDTAAQWEDNPTGLAALHEELAIHRQAIETHRAEVQSIRNLIDTGAIQVGIGDERDRRDARLREEYDAVVRRQRDIIGRMGGGGADLARAADIAERIDSVHATLGRFDAEVTRRADQQSMELRDQLTTERGNIETYARELAELEALAEDVIGHEAYRNFRSVRDRFHDLVRQADVGTVDVAWAEREEHRHRIDRLSEERRVQLQTLADEFREVTEEQEAEAGGAE